MVDEDCGDLNYCLYEIENSKCLPCIPTDMVRKYLYHYELFFGGWAPAIHSTGQFVLNSVASPVTCNKLIKSSTRVLFVLSLSSSAFFGLFGAISLLTRQERLMLT